MAMKMTWEKEGLRRQSGAPQRGEGGRSFFRVNLKRILDFGWQHYDFWILTI